MSEISVIIPNYNRATIIGETIQNMLNQSLPPDEIIIIDDGSTDSSVEVIKSFGNKIKLIQQENLGPGAARNVGLKIASGKYIQFMDSDDLASLNKLEVQLSALKKTGADFAYCPWIRSKINQHNIQFVGPVIQGERLPDFKPMLEWQLGNWCLVFQNCLFRREILTTAGEYRTDLMPSEDSEYLVRILLSGATPVYSSNCILFYRVEGSNQNQITSNGTHLHRRIADKTNYFGIIGHHVANMLFDFHNSTKKEIVLALYKHNRYCDRMNQEGVSRQNSFYRLLTTYPKYKVKYWDFKERIKRKLSSLPNQNPLSEGLMYRPISCEEKRMAQNIGLGIIKN